jgi:tetratricopeptide (TPR) repeat protein
LVSLLTQIARAESVQGKLADAELTLDRAAKLLASMVDVEPRLRFLLERGRLLALRRTPAQARDCFIEVWNEARAQGFAFHAVDAAQMMSVIETPKARSKWTVLALELADQSTDARVHGWRGDLHIALGRYYEGQLQLSKAIECFERAATCFQEKGAGRDVWLARSHVGRSYRLSNRLAEALQIQEAALRELSRSGADLAMILEEIGECLMALKRAPEAEPFFKRAYDAVAGNEDFIANERARFQRLKTLGKVK